MRTAKTLISLIWVFAGRTCHFVDFVRRWLICFIILCSTSVVFFWCINSACQLLFCASLIIFVCLFLWCWVLNVDLVVSTPEFNYLPDIACENKIWDFIWIVCLAGAGSFVGLIVSVPEFTFTWYSMWKQDLGFHVNLLPSRRFT